jgi:hypothetical protein
MFMPAWCSLGKKKFYFSDCVPIIASPTQQLADAGRRNYVGPINGFTFSFSV